MPNNSEINYSLGVLIILIMVFWFVCKCIGQSNYKSYYEKEKMTNMNVDHGFYYGNTPLYLGTPTGINYIRTNKRNVVEVPNSMTAMRELYDEEHNRCQTLDTLAGFDQAPAKMTLQKKIVREAFKNRRPSSMTSTRENMCNDRHTRIPMSSY